MNLRAQAVIVGALLLCAACGGGDTGSEAVAEWVGTTSSEGDVTTVVNESGSVWGGAATLVEEASIGVEAGDDAYMFGRVRSIAAADGRIYVVDDQVPAVRVYDWDGNWVQDLGGEGQGPGEYRAPSGVAVDAQGRIWVHEQSATRMSIFSPAGEVLVTHNTGGMRISGSSSSMTLGTDGRAWVFDVLRPEDPSQASRIVMKPVDFEGNVGEPVDVPQFENNAGVEARSDNAVRFAQVPFHANGTTDFTREGIVLSGYSDAYRFEMLHPDGRRTVVERFWEPTAVLSEEAEAHRAAVTRYMREMDPDWTWNAEEIPATKQAFSDLIATVSGEIWVVRPGTGAPVPDCEEGDDSGSTPRCWTEARIVDAFGVDGRYLGEVELPDEVALRPPPYIDGTDVIARVEDDNGTVRVKRYRLELPPAAGQ